MDHTNHHIDSIDKLTEHKYLNMYGLNVTYADDRHGVYMVASRSQTIDNLKISTRNDKPDAVVIFSLYGEKKDRVVLVRQYRYPLDDYIYELPAGLIDPGENAATAAIREMKEETGLAFEPVPAPEAFCRPFYTSCGMTDECCSLAFGYATGTPSGEFLEVSEDLQYVLADRDEVRRILKEERVALMCAYQLMHFIGSPEDDPLAFLGKY